MLSWKDFPVVSITTVAGSILCGICSSGCMRYIVYEGTVWQSRRVCGGEESCAHMTRHCMGSRATMFPVRVTVLVGAVPHSHVFRLIPFDHNILWCRAANAASVSMPPGHNCHLTNAANDEPANLERWIAPTRLELIGINVPHSGHKLAPSAIGLDRPPGPPWSAAVDFSTHCRHRWAGRAGADPEGAHPTPVLAYGQDNVDDERQAFDIADEHEASELSAQERYIGRVEAFTI